MALLKKLKSKIIPVAQENLKDEKIVYNSDNGENFKEDIVKTFHDHREIIKKKMLSRQEYVDLIKIREDSERFGKRIRGDNQLYFYGDTHKNDLQHPEFICMEAFIEDFFQKNKGKKNIAMVEGGVRRDVDIKNVDFAVEAEFLKYFADRNNCETISPEPFSKHEVEYALQQGVDKKYLAYYYVGRVIDQRHRGTQVNKQPLEKYIEGFFKRNEFIEIYGESYSLDLFKQIHHSILGDELDLMNKAHFESISNPYYNYSPEISNASYISGTYRDNYIVNKTLQYLDNGYNVIIIYGRGHLIKQHKIFETYFNEPQ